MRRSIEQTPVVEYASEEEKYFAAWVKEAKENGLILDEKYQPTPFKLSEKVQFIDRYLKNGKPNYKHLLFEHTYQPDWIIVWSRKAIELGFCSILNDHIVEKGILFANRKNGSVYSVIDVKGGFAQNDRFPLNQKWVYSTRGIYVNKVIPYDNNKIKTCFFTVTWTPQAYWFRPKKRQKGEFLKVNSIPRTFNEFVKTIK